MKNFFTICILSFFISANADEADSSYVFPNDSAASGNYIVSSKTDSSSVPSDTSALNASIIQIIQRNPVTQVISLPFRYVIQPAVEFLLYPMIPPLLYISRENIIEKGLNVISFGDEKQIMLYPTINAKIGSSSNIGLSYRHSNMLLENDYFVLSPTLYINADWDANIRYQKKRILGTSLYSNFMFFYYEDSDDSFRVDGGQTYLYTDSSTSVRGKFGFNIAGDWGMEFGAGGDFLRFGKPMVNDTVAVNNSAFDDRGFYKHFQQFPLSVSLLYNSLDMPYAATSGNKFSLTYTYTPVWQYNKTFGHNYHAIDSRIVNYSLLGSRSYFMTTKEVVENRERLKNLSFSDAIKILNPINIKEEILDRRILVTQLKFRAMFEENKGQAPFVAMGRLGGNFPLRAYNDGYFTAPFVAGISNEYRWAVDKYADALIFNEYGIYGESFTKLSLDDIKNSWGFGFRVRTPSFFIMRFAMAFHGLDGITVILTIRPEYD